MPPATLIDPSRIDCENIVADTAAIESMIPHRHGMRMLDRIVYFNPDEHLIVGIKDCRDDEFWVAGHMPGYPIFPGVLMCEASAQLAAYYTKYVGIFGKELLGLGGIEEARFRAPVHPGDRLILVAKGIRLDRRKTEFIVHGYVGSTMVFNLKVIGLPIPGHERVNEKIDATGG
jgi:3-hydroxyacyl-[acyl-carrier-protein] dehydratase